jgi:hypothetical protein
MPVAGFSGTERALVRDATQRPNRHDAAREDEMTVQELPAHVLITLLLLATPVTARDMQIYEHPSLDFRFEAPRDWRQQPRPEDKMIYEVADPATNVHVVLWYTSTEQSGPGYLKKMASMKDVVVDTEPIRR